MDQKAEKVLVVEPVDSLREQIVAALSEAGYQVSTDYREGMKAVVALDPDVVILGADPPQLDCCDLLTEIKGSEHTRDIRVVMLSPGGSAGRTRGLDLGADDVLSLPFDPQELRSRVRSQLRNKSAADGSRERLRLAEANRSATQQVVRAVNEERRTLRVGGLVAAAVLLIAALAFLLSYRRTQEQNIRVYAAITRLQAGVLTQQQLMERSRRGLQDQDHGPSPAHDPQKLELQKKSADLRSQIAVNKTENADALQSQLATVENRLEKIETEGKFAERIIQAYEPSVCLIHVVLAFREHTTGSRLRYAGLTASGEPATDEHNNPLVSLTGSGPEVHLDVFGTGFLVSDTGRILTNHHVAEPWWQNDDLKEMLDQGVEPMIAEMTAYFPGVSNGIAVDTEKISPAADVAVVKGNISGLRIKQILLADGRRSAVSGGPVVLLGYPTALDAILARAGTETLQSIATASKGDPKQVMEELARRDLIRPTTTQGHIGAVLPDKIVYDAQTTSGGSGGPLFNNEGKVIGINFAMVREFGGSNFAIPVSYGQSLLKP
ncbi:MAG TPA: trypsin-like peptidase domain-containing protein [Terriglobales bacterium]|nr:trypsin-like peptidase domain-containing protein [Terriglobales bacterium]